MGIENALLLEQEQRLSLFQLQSLQVLSLPNDQLHDLLQQEYMENPFMEHRPMLRNDDEKPDYLQSMAAPDAEPIKRFILEQLNPYQFTRQEWLILTYLADCTDDRGFLHLTKEDPILQRTPSGLLKKCLQTLRRLEPAGICSSSLSECLIEQLQHQNLLTSTMQALITNHLEDIAQNRWKIIAESLHMHKKDIEPLIKHIRSLHPFPLEGISSSASSYLIPDIIAQPVGPDIHIFLNDNWMGNYAVSDYYIKMMQQTKDADLKEYFQQKYTRCCMMIQHIEQRRNTLLTLSRSIWEWQKDYLSTRGPLRPMTLQDMSNQTGFHISTISRAVKEKYMQTPVGTIALKKLFQQSCCKGNHVYTQNDIKKQLLQIIANENSATPYSDTDLSKLLSTQCNLMISRRAITKYRMALHIANSYERRLS